MNVREPVVEFRKLTKIFLEAGRERRVLDEVDGQIAEGEFVALLGRSGSGKSTLLNLVAGIDVEDSGSILVAGQKLSKLSESARTRFRRDNIGFVYQFFNLIPTLSVGENLRLPLDLRSVPAAEAQAEAQAWLERIEMPDRYDTFPDRLSGGEQQRVALARALIGQPKIILADEPTGNLDRETGLKVLDLLCSAAKGSGRSMLLVTHSREVARRADRVLQIEDGKLVPLHLDLLPVEEPVGA